MSHWRHLRHNINQMNSPSNESLTLGQKYEKVQNLLSNWLNFSITFKLISKGLSLELGGILAKIYLQTCCRQLIHCLFTWMSWFYWRMSSFQKNMTNGVTCTRKLMFVIIIIQNIIHLFQVFSFAWHRIKLWH